MRFPSSSHVQFGPRQHLLMFTIWQRWHIRWQMPCTRWVCVHLASYSWCSPFTMQSPLILRSSPLTLPLVASALIFHPSCIAHFDTRLIYLALSAVTLILLLSRWPLNSQSHLSHKHPLYRRSFNSNHHASDTSHRLHWLISHLVPPCLTHTLTLDSSVLTPRIIPIPLGLL